LYIASERDAAQPGRQLPLRAAADPARHLGARLTRCHRARATARRAERIARARSLQFAGGMRKVLLVVIAAGVLWTWCGRGGGRARLSEATRRTLASRVPAAAPASPQVYRHWTAAKAALDRAEQLVPTDPATAARDALAVARDARPLARMGLLGGKLGAVIEQLAIDIVASAAPRIDASERHALANEVDLLIARAPTARDILFAEADALDREILHADATGTELEIWQSRAPSPDALAQLNERLRDRWGAAPDDAAIPDACAAELGDERFCRVAAELAIARADNLAELRKVARALER
jgi:hypothetical protein